MQCTSCLLEDASWEDFSEFCKLYPSYRLKDKVNFEAGGNDTLPLSLEPIVEVLKDGKMAQDVNKEAQEMTEDPIVETQPKKEDARPKRVTKKPTYHKDCVRAE